MKNKSLYLCILCPFLVLNLLAPTPLNGASPAAELIETEYAKAALDAQVKKAHGQNPYESYGVATATIVKVAANASKTERDEILNLLGAALKKIFQIPSSAPASYTPDNSGADIEVGKPFAEHMPNYASAVSSVITSTLFKFRSNKKLQASIINALCYYLKELFNINDMVHALFEQVPNSLESWGQVASDIILNKLQPQPPLQRGLIVNALCEELMDRSKATAVALVGIDTKKLMEEISDKFQQAKTAQDYASIIKKIVAGLGSQLPYERYLIIKKIQSILLWYITPTPTTIVQEQQTGEPQKACDWYQIDCWVVQLHEITTQAVWKPFGEFAAKTATQIAKTASDTGNIIEKGFNDIGTWVSARFKDTQVTRAIDYGIRKAALESALAIATGVLTAAQETARGTLSASKATAQAAMSASQDFLDGINTASQSLLQGTADIATGSIEGVKQGGLVVLEQGKIVTKKLLETFDINEISYRGSLQSLKNGSLGNVRIQAELFKQKLNLNVTLDVKKGYDVVVNELTNAVKPIIDKLNEELLTPFMQFTKKLESALKKLEQTFQPPAALQKQIVTAQEASRDAYRLGLSLQTQEKKAEASIENIIVNAHDEAIKALQEEEKKAPEPTKK